MNVSIERLNQALEMVSESASERDLVAIEGFLILLNIDDAYWDSLLRRDAVEEEFETEFEKAQTKLLDSGVVFKSDE